MGGCVMRLPVGIDNNPQFSNLLPMLFEISRYGYSERCFNVYPLNKLIEKEKCPSVSQMKAFVKLLLQKYGGNTHDIELLLMSFGLHGEYQDEAITARHKKYSPRFLETEYKGQNRKTLAQALHSLPGKEETKIRRFAYRLIQGKYEKEIVNCASLAKTSGEFQHALPLDAKPLTIIREEIEAVLASEDDTKKCDFTSTRLPLQNEFFTGRYDILSEIYKRFHSGLASRIQQITGLGGIGKTQVVKEYAYQHKKEYDLLVWIDSSDNSNILPTITQTLINAGILNEKEVDYAVITLTIRTWMATHDKWLFIFDNLEYFDQLDDILPKKIGGHILITSLVTIDDLGEVINLGVFSDDEAIQFLGRRALGKNDYENAQKVSRRLGNYPLALEHIATYVESSPGASFASCVQMLESLGIKFLDGLVGSTEYKYTIREALEKILDKLHAKAKTNSIMHSAEQFEPV